MIEVNTLQAVLTLLATTIGGGGMVKLMDYFFIKPGEKLDTYPALIEEMKRSLYDPLKIEVQALHLEVRDLRAKVNIYENHLMNTKKGEDLVLKTRKQFATK